MTKIKTNKKRKSQNNKTIKILNSSFVIAIPSHNREELIQKTTLKLLKNHKINFKNVYVFSSPESFVKYKSIQQLWGFKLIKSRNSIKDKRNHIIKYFESGQKIIEMDDDIENIMHTVKKKKRTPINNLKRFFNECFSKLNKKGLWGLNSTDSTLSPNGLDKFGTYTIVSACCGYYNDKRIKLTVEEKEDFERVVQFYKLKLPVLKRGAYGIKTKYWINPGGIQSRYSKEERIKVQKKSAEKLMKKYPEFFNKSQRENGLVDLRFKNRNPLNY